MRLAAVLLAASALYAQRPEHPRPDFERSQWMTLNGQWDFGFNDKFGRTITVPFCWESELSGIATKSARPPAGIAETSRFPRHGQASTPGCISMLSMKRRTYG